MSYFYILTLHLVLNCDVGNKYGGKPGVTDKWLTTKQSVLIKTVEQNKLINGFFKSIFQ